MQTIHKNKFTTNKMHLSINTETLQHVSAVTHTANFFREQQYILNAAALAHSFAKS
jgi:hypothetical protein